MLRSMLSGHMHGICMDCIQYCHRACSGIPQALVQAERYSWHTSTIRDMIATTNDMTSWMFRVLQDGICGTRERGLCMTQLLPLRLSQFNHRHEAKLQQAILSNLRLKMAWKRLLTARKQQLPQKK